jgi:bidirectional [NiFe] hydrogenase diaphorase subunit
MSEQTPQGAAAGEPPAASRTSSVLARLRAQQAAGGPAAAPAAAPKGEADTAAKPKPAPKEAAPHPSGDNRFKLLDAAMKKHRFAADSLIEVLHTAQEVFGYLKPDLLIYIAQGLKLPPSRVYGVATFYHFFTFKPKGDHTCVVCMGTACYVKGADAVQAAIAAFAKEHPELGTVSVETARCVGACGLAPVVVYDGEVVGNLNAETARGRMKGWTPDGSQ